MVVSESENEIVNVWQETGKSANSYVCVERDRRLGRCKDDVRKITIRKKNVKGCAREGKKWSELGERREKKDRWSIKSVSA